MLKLEKNNINLLLILLFYQIYITFFRLRIKRRTVFSYIFDENIDDNEINHSDTLLGNSLSGKVLVLNNSYEPISICSTRKAILLLYLSKAEVVEKHNKSFIHSAYLKLPRPSVIKLNQYIKIPFRKIEPTRRNILKRDDFRCQYCGKKGIELTLDHIIPKSRGGLDVWDNLVTACHRCNNKKGNHTPEEASMKLLSKISKPNYILFLKQTIGKIDDKWKPFLFME